MGVDEEFERVRTVLRAEEQALAQEFEQIDAEARAAVDASVAHVRAELATQADRIREAIAQQRDDVEARSEELRAEVEGAATTTADGADLAGDDAGDDHLHPSASAGDDGPDGEGPDGDDASGDVASDDVASDDVASDDDASDLVGGTVVDEETQVEVDGGTVVDQETPAGEGDDPHDTIGDVERGD